MGVSGLDAARVDDIDVVAVSAGARVLGGRAVRRRVDPLPGVVGVRTAARGGGQVEVDGEIVVIAVARPEPRL